MRSLMLSLNGDWSDIARQYASGTDPNSRLFGYITPSDRKGRYELIFSYEGLLKASKFQLPFFDKIGAVLSQVFEESEKLFEEVLEGILEESFKPIKENLLRNSYIIIKYIYYVDNVGAMINHPHLDNSILSIVWDECGYYTDNKLVVTKFSEEKVYQRLDLKDLTRTPRNKSVVVPGLRLHHEFGLPFFASPHGVLPFLEGEEKERYSMVSLLTTSTPIEKELVKIPGWVR